MPALKLYTEDGAPQAPPAAQLPIEIATDARLSARAKVLIWGLCNWAWRQKADCHPGNKRIAAVMGKSVRWVQLAMRDAEDAGYLRRRMAPDGKGWHRVITMTWRERRTLGLVSDGGDAPGEGSCATGAQALAPPPAQGHSPQLFEPGSSKETEPGVSGRVVGSDPTPTPPKKVGDLPAPRMIHLLSPLEFRLYRAVITNGSEADMEVSLAKLGLILHDRASAALARGEVLPE